MNNNERYDLSNRLIHFFRDVEEISLEKLPSFIENPQQYKGEKESAFFFLQETVKHKLLPSTWSERKNSGNCIYGNIPAICFTEMPLPAFIESANFRYQKNEKISVYGLIFRKNDLYKLGARPVIYGLSKNNNCEIIPGKNGSKQFDKNIFPEKELYRYVPYEPFDKDYEGGIDFTHEREWRLPIIIDNDVEDDSAFYFTKTANDSNNFLPNLRIKKKYLEDVGIIVKTDEEYDKIIKILKNTYKDTKAHLCPYTYIIVENQFSMENNMKDFQCIEGFIENARKKLKEVW